MSVEKPVPGAKTVTEEKTVIRTAAAPTPAGVYSQGVRAGGLLQVAGQGSADPETGRYLGVGDPTAQTHRALQNVKAILEAGGATMEDVIMVRVYLTTRVDFAEMNAAYGAFMSAFVPSGALPARTTVFVDLPDEDMLVEIDALAVLP